MKRPFNLLISDKEPIEYVEKAIVMLKDNRLVAISKEETRFIPIGSTLLLFLGPGTSISADAARMAARHDMFIAFVRGGINIHSLWHTGRWPEPTRFVKQVQQHADPKKRLSISKKMTYFRIKKEGGDNNWLDQVKRAPSIEKILSIEALWAKQYYASLAKTYNIDKFRRDHQSKEGINSSISLLNNVLYAFITSVIIGCQLHPSVGFTHGKTRRGGLAFDIADLFKSELVLVPAFTEYKLDPKVQMIRLSQRLKRNGNYVIKEVIKICNWIIEEENWEDEINCD